jgi:hypothetical protein
LLAYADGKGLVISSDEDLKTFIKEHKHDLPLCIVAQTTQDIKVFEKICLKLKKHFKKVKEINTICDATKNRQEEVARKASGVDFTLVVGGKHSANTTRLFEIAKGLCPGTVLHMERADELLPELKKNIDSKAFITAGASTPLWIVHEIAEKINSKKPLNVLLRILSSFYFMFISILTSLVFFLFHSVDTSSFLWGLCIIASMVLAGTGVRHVYLEKLDVFKIAYSYGRRFFIVGVLLLSLIALFYTQVLWVFVLYYCILFYMIYKIMMPRALLLSLCNVIFLLLPWLIN